jgi:hypothetical protein
VAELCRPSQVRRQQAAIPREGCSPGPDGLWHLRMSSYTPAAGAQLDGCSQCGNSHPACGELAAMERRRTRQLAGAVTVVARRRGINNTAHAGVASVTAAGLHGRRQFAACRRLTAATETRHPADGKADGHSPIAQR